MVYRHENGAECFHLSLLKIRSGALRDQLLMVEGVGQRGSRKLLGVTRMGRREENDEREGKSDSRKKGRVDDQVH